jgi:hypothetical protein
LNWYEIGGSPFRAYGNATGADRGGLNFINPNVLAEYPESVEK